MWALLPGHLAGRALRWDFRHEKQRDDPRDIHWGVSLGSAFTAYQTRHRKVETIDTPARKSNPMWDCKLLQWGKRVVPGNELRRWLSVIMCHQYTENKYYNAVTVPWLLCGSPYQRGFSCKQQHPGEPKKYTISVVSFLGALYHPLYHNSKIRNHFLNYNPLNTVTITVTITFHLPVDAAGETFCSFPLP